MSLYLITAAYNIVPVQFIFTVFPNEISVCIPAISAAKMFDPESRMEPGVERDGAYFLDRDPHSFAILLNYLRSGVLFGTNTTGPPSMRQNFFSSFSYTFILYVVVRIMQLCRGSGVKNVIYRLFTYVLRSTQNRILIFSGQAHRAAGRAVRGQIFQEHPHLFIFQKCLPN